MFERPLSLFTTRCTTAGAARAAASEMQVRDIGRLAGREGLLAAAEGSGMMLLVPLTSSLRFSDAAATRRGEGEAGAAAGLWECECLR
jgi:hypothetical protein